MVVVDDENDDYDEEWRNDFFTIKIPLNNLSPFSFDLSCTFARFSIICSVVEIEWCVV